MRPWQVWTAYAGCLTVAATALGMLTVRALATDRAEAAARREAAVEETIRLALWRLDSAAAPLVARESAVDGPTAVRPPVRVRFQVTDTGTCDLRGGDDQALARALVAAWRPGGSLAALAAAGAPPAGPPVGAAAAAFGQRARNADELRARRQIVEQGIAQNAAQLPGTSTEVAPAGALAPLWLADRLVLARRGPDAGVEGCELDWPRLRAELTAAITDLLPAARLVPAVDAAADDPRLMAALPVRLEPGMVASAPVPDWSPLTVALVAAWLAMSAAAAAAAVLLAGVLALSERRAAFVSSVTHELRTPLTAFRLHAGLLEEGMVPAADVAACHATLRTEADRLAHLVENVLAYARLERGAPGPRPVPVGVSDLLARIGERPAERARQAGLDWRVTVAADALDARVQADPDAVEQVLFNLVDNACKYGRGGVPAIEFSVSRRGDRVALAVRDHGPGLAPREAARLFQPFRRSARDAAGGPPGVGLGLALARRLARQMGGELHAESPADGGCRFVLTLRG